ncbi:DUF2092 domain-containing protein [Paludisphaera mucosa]|uniref:DUF2092 domain-containing protein n=1 Tax=Paludisphaera mucosa TaxID=3030827 RepID=A0ABT6FAP5_9BACT|nr:DUF2092 domain-containing protein [Paludisphaera mucosa]MDG3004626.1 DUF2092 domain-containing protein [Paludisphaera mucosa]
MLASSLVLALTLLGQALADQPLAEPGRVAPEFVATLEKAQATMAGLKSYSVAARVKSTLTDPAGGPDAVSGSTSTQTIVASRPGRFAVASDWAAFGEAEERPALRVACDGRKLVTYYVPDGLYAEYEGPDPGVQVYHQHIVESTLDASGLSVMARPDLREHVLRHARSASVDGEEVVDGVPTTRFRVDYDGMPVVMWVGPKDAPLLRRMELTFESAAPGGPKLVTARRSDLTWTLDVDVPDSAFVLAVPAEAKRVDDVFAAMIAARTPSILDKPAPELALANLEGEEVALAATTGKPTVLVFWATWAAGSGESLGQVAALNRALGDRARLLVVSMGDTADQVKARIQGVAGLPTILVDPQDAASAAYGVKDVPSAVVIAADGKVVYAAPGFDLKVVADKAGVR